MNSGIHRALVFQGGGSLGAYEAGAYKDINEELSRYLKAEGRGNEPIFHIVAGTSIGAIKAAILVIHVNYFKDFCFCSSTKLQPLCTSYSNPCEAHPHSLYPSV
jgi:hypothetical protein